VVVHQVFKGCSEWDGSGLQLATLKSVSAMELITTCIPESPEDVKTTLNKWMSRGTKTSPSIYVWMGAEDWLEHENFSISGAPKLQIGYFFSSEWEEGSGWTVGMKVI